MSDGEIDLRAVLRDPNTEKRTEEIGRELFDNIWDSNPMDNLEYVQENVDEEAVAVTGASAQMRPDESGMDYEVEYYVIQDEQ